MLVTASRFHWPAKPARDVPLHLAMFGGIQRLVGHRLNGFLFGEQVDAPMVAHINEARASVGSRATISSSFPVTGQRCQCALRRPFPSGRPALVGQRQGQTALIEDLFTFVCRLRVRFLLEPQAVPP